MQASTKLILLDSLLQEIFRESSTRTNHKLIVDNELSWRPRSLVQLHQPESPEMQARVPGTDQEAPSGRHGLVLHWHEGGHKLQLRLDHRELWQEDGDLQER